MQSELDIIDDLNALAYGGQCLQNGILVKAIEEGINNAAFRELIYWLCNELHVLRKTDESISSAISDPSEFAIELSAMLKELSCPYETLVLGASSQRYSSKTNCLILLGYLTSELMAIKMILRLRPLKENDKTKTDTAGAIEQLEKYLSIEKPPVNIAPKALFDKINFKVEERLRVTQPGGLSEPMLGMEKTLTDEQWQKLEAMHAEINGEYNLRRELLLTRLEVTVQSFNWSERIQKQEPNINKVFKQNLEALKTLMHNGKETDIVALLAARKDLAIIEKTSSANVRKNTASNIQKHVIGSVPDRGGRTYELAPPPPEMPAWQTRRAGPVGGHRGGGGRGNRGGANWQPQPQRQQYQHQNKSQFDNQQRNNQNWLNGSGRVQGMGWSQNNNNNNNRSNNHENNNDNRNDNDNRRGGGGGGYSRGHSNYNRGGRR